MAPTHDALDSANYIISVYAGYIIIVTGVIGNLIIILIFTQLKLFRGNQSAFCLLITAIVESLLLVVSVATRVIAATFGSDPTRTSIVWCKIRAYLVQLGSTSLAMTICFASIDQCFSTSYHNRVRQISTFKLAKQVNGIIIILSALYSISFPIFNEIRLSAGCATYNPSFNYFFSFVHLCIVIGILPIVISTLFSLLSYRNVRRITRRQIPIVRRRLDRQLTAMILVRVALFVITTLIFVAFRAYQINNPVGDHDDYGIAVNNLIRTIATTIYNIDYCGSFYVYWLTSTRFRRQVKYVFSKKMWRKYLFCQGNRNQIEAVNELQTVEPQSAMAAD